MINKMVILALHLPIVHFIMFSTEYGDVFKDKRIRERQLFISLSCLDLRPLEASLFRLYCCYPMNILISAICLCVGESVKCFS